MARQTSATRTPKRSASVRRGRWSRWTKTIAVVLASIGLVVVAMRGGERLFVRHLARQIDSASDADAARLVSDLAQLSAFPELVTAANSSRSAVALAARREVDQLVDAWQLKSFLHPATFALRAKALPLAVALESQADELSPSNRRWARRTLENLLRLAEDQPFETRMEFLQTCDRALAKLPPEETSRLVENSMSFDLVIDAPSAPQKEADHRRPERVVPPYDGSSEPSTSPAADSIALENPRIAPLPKSLSSEDLDWNPIWGAPSSPKPLVESPRAIVDLDGRPLAEESSNSLPSPTPRDEAPAEIAIDDARPIAEQQDDFWFTLLASGTAEQQRVAADKLHELGYGHVTPRDARMLVSTSLRDRLALVDLALTSPRLESDKWLWRLAQDQSGEVRAAAIASIATSKDAQLIEKAMELTLHDTDPRVAEQSSELRRRLR